MDDSAKGRTAKAPRRAKGEDGRHQRGNVTRERILLAAERLFAELGLSNVSLRDVGAAAGQRNNGAVQYHFGDRENLIREINVHRARAVEEVRAELLARVVSREKPAQVRDYVETFVVSLATNLEEGNHFLRFLSRLVIERGEIFDLDVVPPSTITFMRRVMRELLPDLSDAIIEDRWRILMTSTVHMLSAYQAAEKAGTLSAPLENLLDDLVGFLTAGLQAPPVSGTKRLGGREGPLAGPAPTERRPKTSARREREDSRWKG